MLTGIVLLCGEDEPVIEVLDNTKTKGKHAKNGLEKINVKNE